MAWLQEGCTVGIDRDRRIVCRSGKGEFRVPRALVPLLLVAALLAVFVRRGTKGEHIAAAEQLHSCALRPIALLLLLPLAYPSHSCLI